MSSFSMHMDIDTIAIDHIALYNSPAAVGSQIDMGTAKLTMDNLSLSNQTLLFGAADASRLKHARSRARAVLDQPRFESLDPTIVDSLPRSKKLRVEDSDSSDSTSNARSSYGTTCTSRSSITSMNSNHMNLSTMDTATSTQTSALPAHKAYMCPKCNMGSGHFTRIYEWAKDKQSGSKRKVAAPRNKTNQKDTSSVLLQFPEYKSQWDTREPFDKHIMEDHIDDFQRSNSSEYVCCYCICECVRGRATCPARFHDDKGMVEHLHTFHAQGPRRLPSYEHYCAPISKTSYVPLIREQAQYGHRRNISI